MSSTVRHLGLNFFSFVLLCSLLCLTGAQNVENSESCACVEKEKCGCTCRNVFSAESLNAESDMFPSCKEFELRLENSVLPFLPNRLFSKMKQPTRLRLKLHKSTVYLLAFHSNIYSPFQNITFEDIDLSVEKSLTISGWKWEVFQQLSPTSGGLLSFNVIKTELLYLPDEFSTVAGGEINSVRILECRLRWLGKTVFALLHKLRTLELRNNLLQDISRSQLPQSPSELTVLDLGNNRLSHIPHDLLEDLPIKVFYIDQNYITCLEPSIMFRVHALGVSELAKMPLCNTNASNTN